MTLARHAGSSGFTLLELLVALVVFGLVMAGLTQGMQLGRRMAERQGAQVAAGSELDAVDRVLRGLVARMDPGTSTSAPALVGRAHLFAFATAPGPMPGAGAAGGTIDAVLAVSGGQLVLRWTPHRHAAPLAPAPPPVDTVLLSQVAAVDFAYFGRPADGNAVWSESWQGQSLPALVRIHIRFPAGGRGTWPDIIEAPVLTKLNG